MASETWKEIEKHLTRQKNVLSDSLCHKGCMSETIEATAIRYVEASTEVWMYEEFIKLDELIFGPKEASNDRTESE